MFRSSKDDNELAEMYSSIDEIEITISSKHNNIIDGRFFLSTNKTIRKMTGSDFLILWANHITNVMKL